MLRSRSFGAAAVLAAVLLAAACTPTRTQLPPEYIDDDVSAARARIALVGDPPAIRSGLGS